jgi:hypothetical protein
MKAIEIARVISHPQPSEGQTHRSSANFSTESMLAGTQYVSFSVDGSGNDDGVFFDVMEDISMKGDKVIYHNASNGYRSSDVTKYDNLYIANPQGAQKDFEVIVYANV